MTAEYMFIHTHIYIVYYFTYKIRYTHIHLNSQPKMLLKAINEIANLKCKSL